MHNHCMPSMHAFRFVPAAPAALVVTSPSPSSLLPHKDREEGAVGVLEVPRAEGLELLEWLGLGRPEFGAIGGRELAPLCRRRLWNVARNANTTLRARTHALLSVAERAGEGMVLFG